MDFNFNIEYHTEWGENLFLVSGGKKYPMKYCSGGIWTLNIPGEELDEDYHYEVSENGRTERREWRNHIRPDIKSGEGTETIADKWLDIPQAAPFYTSAFSDGVFLVDQEHIGKSGKVPESSPEELYKNRWKCAGTAVPVFSLRSKESFGIGDFNDLKKLIDWACATGQRIIQLLPVNDTTMSGTWTDSYPYSSNSIFALHPQFLYLPGTGVRRDSSYKALQAELEALPTVDYERVNKEKDRLARKAFSSRREKISADPDYNRFYKDNAFWLEAYCAFRILRDKFGSADFSKWGEYAVYDRKKIHKLLETNKYESEYHSFVQYQLHRQLKEAKEYAGRHGIALKGDLPIGVSRTGMDAWQNPTQFHLDSQAGAPPDAFATDGQNWGFPTYNWEQMEKDGYSWWKARLKNMEQYFDAFRIDHILGFFRIWEIPVGARSGLMGHFNPALPFSEEELKDKGFDLSTGWYTEDGLNTLFVEDPRRKGYWHPRIAAQNTQRYLNLPGWQKDSYNRLYDDFFYHRHNDFWKESAMKKLPELLAATVMLTCGEDLGMIPACVPEVMNIEKILSLEIQRMPKDPSRAFADTWQYPYLSVCATSTHDMSPLRAWWKENREMTSRFWNEILGHSGEAPQECTPDICRSIIMMHLQSMSMLAILPLQDYLSLKPELCFDNPDDERINVPAITPYYWRFRMKVNIEDLIEDDLTPYLKSIIRSCGRL